MEGGGGSPWQIFPGTETPWTAKQKNHINSFETISKRWTLKFYSWTQYDFSVNKCDWCILAGNEKKNCVGKSKSRPPGHRPLCTETPRQRPPWTETPPPLLWTEWQTGVKTLHCPKLRLWMVTRKHSIRMRTSREGCTVRSKLKMFEPARGGGGPCTVRSNSNKFEPARVGPCPGARTIARGGRGGGRGSLVGGGNDVHY